MKTSEICGCEKKTIRTDEQKKALAHRLNRIEGQVKARLCGASAVLLIAAD